MKIKQHQHREEKKRASQKYPNISLLYYYENWLRRTKKACKRMERAMKKKKYTVEAIKRRTRTREQKKKFDMEMLR